ncbi:hypothetical protein F4827_004916 [Paraburkholderia bannensis]|uniref:DUF2242 domain-containing protein n=1 Tax=Paraburkholderia bannensis TaxID=765414 RepID=A0A7W9U2E6_9BURK|nr:MULTISPECIES: DUF2242 domain-containing protein [Paraburkholderia]MBB3260239.1 hypothetical protein [Paraburkholderia sp. WP4_3_2]MBB6105051.1 hypothetical protein [Paraburkholderia bannensis]
MPRFSRLTPFLLIPLVAALGACSSAKPSNQFQDDQLLSSAPSQFSRNFSYASADACEASRRALLSQGYMTTMTHNDTVDATKNFQPTSDQHIVVEVHVVCTVADATNTSMVYVNAVQNGYALKKSDTSASVGLSILGSVSLPIRSNSDEMVKVSSETIQSGAFYTRFFDLVGKYLNTVAKSEPVPGSGAIKITPLPPSLEPSPALANGGVPGVATPGMSASPAAAVTAAFTGAAAVHNDALPATPVLGAMQPIQPTASAQTGQAVHAVMPVAAPATATLLTPVVPAAVAAAASAASAASPSTAAVPAAAAASAAQASAALPASAAASAAPSSATPAAAAKAP